MRVLRVLLVQAALQLVDGRNVQPVGVIGQVGLAEAGFVEDQVGDPLHHLPRRRRRLPVGGEVEDDGGAVGVGERAVSVVSAKQHLPDALGGGLQRTHKLRAPAAVDAGGADVQQREPLLRHLRGQARGPAGVLAAQAVHPLGDSLAHGLRSPTVLRRPNLQHKVHVRLRHAQVAHELDQLVVAQVGHVGVNLVVEHGLRRGRRLDVRGEDLAALADQLQRGGHRVSAPLVLDRAIALGLQVGAAEQEPHVVLVRRGHCGAHHVVGALGDLYALRVDLLPAVKTRVVGALREVVHGQLIKHGTNSHLINCTWFRPNAA